MGSLLDLTGEKFGKLTAISKIKEKRRRVMWLCLCDCGKKIETYTISLRSGSRKSCGCNHSWSNENNPKFSHGFKGTRIYNLWKGARVRCYNKNRAQYKDYGGRGITMSKEWDNFSSFKNDMYESYLKHVKEFGEKNTTLDRIDVNGNYCKENCKWSTMAQQGRNKTNNIKMNHKGEYLTIPEISEKTGKTKNSLYKKYYKTLNN